MKPAQRRKLPKGMGQRKGADGHVYYYTRVRRDGEDRRILHGTDLELAKLEHQRHRVQRVREPWIPVRAAWPQWHALDFAKWKPKNRRIVETRFKAYVDPLLGSRRVSDLTEDDSRRLAQHLADEKLSLQTQAHVLTHWSRFGRWLASARFVRQSPVPPKGLRPKVPDSEPDPLTEDELAKLRGIGERYELAIRLMLATGLRWSDAVRVQASNLTADGWLVITCSKTGRLLRVPLGETDPDLAREMRRRIGRLVDFARVESFNRTVQRRSGLDRFSTYRLRDTFACRWMDEGGSISDLQKILGHRSPETTQRYGRPSDARIRAEARRIAEARRTKSDVQVAETQS
jgi:integrase